MFIDFLTAAAVDTARQIPDWFVVVMGVGTVFVGLISIIIICLITGAIFGGSKKAQIKEKKDTPVKANGAKVEDLKIVAAVCAAAAEDMGTDVNALRVVSFKKL